MVRIAKKIRDKEAFELYEKGWSDKKIADYFSCSQQSFTIWRYSRGLITKNPNYRKINTPLKKYQEIKKKDSIGIREYHKIHNSIPEVKEKIRDYMRIYMRNRRLLSKSELNTEQPTKENVEVVRNL